MDALEKAAEYAEGAPEAEVIETERVAAKNAAAVAALNTQMRGLR